MKFDGVAKSRIFAKRKAQTKNLGGRKTRFLTFCEPVKLDGFAKSPVEVALGIAVDIAKHYMSDDSDRDSGRDSDGFLPFCEPIKFVRNICVICTNPAEATGRDFFDADTDADRCESLRLGRGRGFQYPFSQKL